jgi:hypothetical protein
MAILFVGRYNGRITTFSESPGIEARTAALKLFGKVVRKLDGAIVEKTDPNPSIHFNYIDSFRQNQPPDKDIQPTVKWRGWIAIVPDESYTEMMKALGYPNGALWQMFDIDVISLNDFNFSETRTQDVYATNTPENNWGARGGPPT